MISQCANPDCHKDFDWHEGQYFRFQSVHNEEHQPRNTHGVVHFWLCGRCSQTYSLDYLKGRGVIVRHRFEQAMSDRDEVVANSQEGR